MPQQNAALSPQFIGTQRKRLEALRDRLLGAEGRALEQERDAQAQHGDEPGDAGDKAQDLPAREVDQALHDAELRRLSDIERALQKIAEGTYGLSDVSGQPIPKERLEASPEAVMNVQEAQASRASTRS
jgi:DnaK suppressor protein